MSKSWNELLSHDGLESLSNDAPRLHSARCARKAKRHQAVVIDRLSLSTVSNCVVVGSSLLINGWHIAFAHIGHRLSVGRIMSCGTRPDITNRCTMLVEPTAIKRSNLIAIPGDQIAINACSVSNWSGPL